MTTLDTRDIVSSQEKTRAFEPGKEKAMRSMMNAYLEYERLPMQPQLVEPGFVFMRPFTDKQIQSELHGRLQTQ